MEFFRHIFGIVCVFVLLGVQDVHCGAASCATPQKIAEVNAIVAAFQSVLDNIFNSDGTEMERYDRVFHTACQNETYSAQVNTLAADVSACFALTMTTTLTTLKFGNITFVDVLTLFPTGGITEFCSCSSYLAGARFLDGLSSQYSVDVANGQYATVANLPFYCMESMSIGQDTFNIKNILNMTLMGMNTTCPRVYTLSGMSSTAIAMHIRDFLPMCATFETAKFQCAVTASATDAFKNCMTGATGGNADCAKFDCVETHINATCGAMSGITYIRAVNIQQGMADLRETKCTDSGTGAASAIQLSFAAIVASIFFVIFV